MPSSLSSLSGTSENRLHSAVRLSFPFNDCRPSSSLPLTPLVLELPPLGLVLLLPVFALSISNFPRLFSSRTRIAFAVSSAEVPLFLSPIFSRRQLLFDSPPPQIEHHETWNQCSQPISKITIFLLRLRGFFWWILISINQAPLIEHSPFFFSHLLRLEHRLGFRDSIFFQTSTLKLK